jgi:hypothetical protein
MYYIPSFLGKQTVILTTIWWWQKLRRDWQLVNKKYTYFIRRDSISRNKMMKRVKSIR